MGRHEADVDLEDLLQYLSASCQPLSLSSGVDPTNDSLQDRFYRCSALFCSARSSLYGYQFYYLYAGY